MTSCHEFAVSPSVTVDHSVDTPSTQPAITIHQSPVPRVSLFTPISPRSSAITSLQINYWIFAVKVVEICQHLTRIDARISWRFTATFDPRRAVFVFHLFPLVFRLAHCKCKSLMKRLLRLSSVVCLSVPRKVLKTKRDRREISSSSLLDEFGVAEQEYDVRFCIRSRPS